MTTIAEASQAIAAIADRPHTTSLYSLAAEYIEAVETGTDEDDVDPQALEHRLDAIHADIRAKAESIAGLSRSLKAMADSRKAEAKFHRDAAAALERKQERLEAYVLRCMDNAGIARMDTGRFSLVPTDNPPSVDILDASVVPGEFQRTVITINVDKRAVLQHYKTTGEIPVGVTISRGRRLDIR